MSECRRCEAGGGYWPHTCTVFERIWRKVRQEGRCWIWTGDNNGTYGNINLDGRLQYVHRAMYEIDNGPIPEGMVIAHRCDTPLCVKPSHLFLTTQLGNVHDMIEKGRARFTQPRPTCAKGHAYTEANTFYRRGGRRSCRECHNARNRKPAGGRGAYKPYVPPAADQSQQRSA